MKVLRGRYRGQTGTLHQFANDWVMVDLDNGQEGVILQPYQIQLSPAECAALTTHVGEGTFWEEWVLNEDGTFSRRSH